MWHYRIVGEAGFIYKSSYEAKGFKGYEDEDTAIEAAKVFANGIPRCKVCGCTIEIIRKVRFMAGRIIKP